MRLRWAAALATAAAVAVMAIGGGAALATPPVTLGSSSEYVLDESGVLSASEATQAQERLEQLKADTGLDLWVAYVDDFSDPADAMGWASQTAGDNNLGVTQYLLAVATEGRAYYLWGDSTGPVSDEQLGTIEQQRIQPALSQNDWLGAIDAAADGLTDAAGGGATPRAAAAGSRGFLLLSP
nr:hypothetical protein GCM10025699_20870 [Microbacterium flavescens]